MINQWNDANPYILEWLRIQEGGQSFTEVTETAVKYKQRIWMKTQTKPLFSIIPINWITRLISQKLKIVVVVFYRHDPIKSDEETLRNYTYTTKSGSRLLKTLSITVIRCIISLEIVRSTQSFQSYAERWMFKHMCRYSRNIPIYTTVPH